jgi:hypothetical protein
MSQIPPEVKQYFSNLGKKAGATTLKRRGKKHYQQMGRKGAAKRWGKKPVDN